MGAAEKGKKSKKQKTKTGKDYNSRGINKTKNKIAYKLIIG